MAVDDSSCFTVMHLPICGSGCMWKWVRKGIPYEGREQRELPKMSFSITHQRKDDKGWGDKRRQEAQRDSVTQRGHRKPKGKKKG